MSEERTKRLFQILGFKDPEIKDLWAAFCVYFNIIHETKKF